MKRVTSALVLLAALVPVSHAAAATAAITGPSNALQGAGRVGNATPTEQPTPPTPPSPPSPAPSTTPPNSPQDSMPGEISVEMQEVLDLVNVERVSRGLVPVRFSSQLNSAALPHTQRQAMDGEIYHNDPDDGSTPGERIARAGYRFSTWGENVAAGYRTPASVMEGWMTSPGHCRNILNPGFTELGVGHVTGGKRYGHFWTQNFGRSADEPRPSGTYDPNWC